MNKIAAIKALRERGVRVHHAGSDPIAEIGFHGVLDLREAKDIVELVLQSALKDEVPKSVLDEVLALPDREQDRLVKTVLDRRLNYLNEVYQHIVRAREAVESLLESNSGRP